MFSSFTVSIESVSSGITADSVEAESGECSLLEDLRGGVQGSLSQSQKVRVKFNFVWEIFSCVYFRNLLWLVGQFL